MNNFITPGGSSFFLLCEKALSRAKTIGIVQVFRDKTEYVVPLATEEIQKSTKRGDSVSS